jgi:hypothetical protein
MDSESRCRDADGLYAVRSERDHTISTPHSEIDQSGPSGGDPRTQLPVGHGVAPPVVTFEEDREIAVLVPGSNREGVLGVVQRRPGKPGRPCDVVQTQHCSACGLMKSNLREPSDGLPEPPEIGHGPRVHCRVVGPVELYPVLGAGETSEQGKLTARDVVRVRLPKQSAVGCRHGSSQHISWPDRGVIWLSVATESGPAQVARAMCATTAIQTNWCGPHISPHRPARAAESESDAG